MERILQKMKQNILYIHLNSCIYVVMLWAVWWWGDYNKKVYLSIEKLVNEWISEWVSAINCQNAHIKYIYTIAFQLMNIEQDRSLFWKIAISHPQTGVLWVRYYESVTFDVQSYTLHAWAG